ncbi:MAG: hypothetical protein MHM6MM_001278 [Cercozoa sp. M6MM]
MLRDDTVWLSHIEQNRRVWKRYHALIDQSRQELVLRTTNKEEEQCLSLRQVRRVLESGDFANALDIYIARDSLHEDDVSAEQCTVQTLLLPSRRGQCHWLQRFALQALRQFAALANTHAVPSPATSESVSTSATSAVSVPTLAISTDSVSTDRKTLSRHRSRSRWFKSWRTPPSSGSSKPADNSADSDVGYACLLRGEIKQLLEASIRAIDNLHVIKEQSIKELCSQATQVALFLSETYPQVASEHDEQRVIAAFYLALREEAPLPRELQTDPEGIRLLARQDLSGAEQVLRAILRINAALLSGGSLVDRRVGLKARIDTPEQERAKTRADTCCKHDVCCCASMAFSACSLIRVDASIFRKQHCLSLLREKKQDMQRATLLLSELSALCHDLHTFVRLQRARSDKLRQLEASVQGDGGVSATREQASIALEQARVRRQQLAALDTDLLSFFPPAVPSQDMDQSQSDYGRSESDHSDHMSDHSDHSEHELDPLTRDADACFRLLHSVCSPDYDLSPLPPPLEVELGVRDAMCALVEARAAAFYKHTTSSIAARRLATEANALLERVDRQRQKCALLQRSDLRKRCRHHAESHCSLMRILALLTQDELASALSMYVRHCS